MLQAILNYLRGLLMSVWPRPVYPNDFISLSTFTFDPDQGSAQFRYLTTNAPDNLHVIESCELVISNDPRTLYEIAAGPIDLLSSAEGVTDDAANAKIRIYMFPTADPMAIRELYSTDYCAAVTPDGTLTETIKHIDYHSILFNHPVAEDITIQWQIYYGLIGAASYVKYSLGGTLSAADNSFITTSVFGVRGVADSDNLTIVPYP